MKTIEITIDDQPVIVQKLSVTKIADLLGSLENLPKIFALIDNKSNEEIIASIGKIIQECKPDAILIIEKSTGLSAEIIDEWGLVDIILVAEAIYEVNQLGVLFDRLKKVKAQPQQEAQKQPSIQSPGSMDR